MRKSSQKIIFLAFLFLAVIQQVFSATVGNPGGTYKTLKAAFDAINNGTLTGAVTLQIVDNTVEPLTATLNASGVGAANYTSVDIYPTVAGRSISMAAATSLINLNGADNVTIDGRVNKAGPADLTISSTNSSIVIPVSTIQFRNDASNNFVRYCKILGTPPINSISGTILFTTGTTTGNNNNTIEYSYITNGRSLSPSILSVGSASIPNKNNVIRFNNFYDCWHTAWASEAILIGDNNDGWTINDNSFYETSNFIVSLPNIMNRFIEVNSLSATNISIIHNYFGGNAPKCTGILQKSGDHSYTQGIYIKAGTGTCKIKNNYFGSINWFNGNRSTDFYVYIIDKGSVSDIELVSNTIGSLDGTSSIQFINSDVQSSNFVGIYNAGSGNFVCDSNALGTITCDMAAGEQGNNFWGIQSDPAATGKIFIRNNTIGSTSPNSIYSKGKANGATTGGTMVGISNEGIGSTIISNNEIQNLRNDGTDASMGNSMLHGIISNHSNDVTVSDNKVHDLHIDCKNIADNHISGSADGNAAITGILVTGEVANAPAKRNFKVERNLIYDLNLTNVSSQSYIYGLYVGADSGTAQTSALVKQNFIHNLNIPAGSNRVKMIGLYEGWYSQSASTCNTENNIIYLRSNEKNFMAGIESRGDNEMTDSYMYHNTSYLEGNTTESSTASGHWITDYDKSTPFLHICDLKVGRPQGYKLHCKNNIFYNSHSSPKGSLGKNYCFINWQGDPVSGGNISYNNFYLDPAATDSWLGQYFKIDKSTLPVNPGMDAMTLTKEPKFNADGKFTKRQAEYYIPCEALQGDVAIMPIVPQDYGNKVRKVPIMGAWEGTGPATPNITGDSVVCSPPKSGLHYTVNPPAANATTYTWTVPAGFTITVPGSGSTVTVPASSPTITVSADATAKTGYVTCYATNIECNTNSAIDSFLVTVGKPVMPGKIKTDSIFCIGTVSADFFVDPVPSAKSYTWTVDPNPPTNDRFIVSGQGTDAITLNLGSTITAPASFKLNVFATNDCGDGPVRTMNIKVYPIPPAPDARDTTMCPNPPRTVSDLKAKTTNPTYYLKWYDAKTGGNFLFGTEKLVDGKTYYVAQADLISGCEGPRDSVKVTFVNTQPKLNLPPTVSYCKSAKPTVQTLKDDMTALPTNNLKPGNHLEVYPDNKTTTPISPTSTALVNYVDYFIAQTDGNCEGPRDTVKVLIIDPKPQIQNPQNFCNGTAIVDSLKFKLDKVGDTFAWYGPNSTTAGPLAGSTLLVDKATYYGIETDVPSGCVGTPVPVVVNIGNPPAPTATSPQKICAVTASDLSGISVTISSGAKKTWYDKPGAGRVVLPSTTPLVDGATYYVTQTIGNCESNPTAVQVNFRPLDYIKLTSAVKTDTQTICIGDNITTITYKTTGAQGIYNYFTTDPTGASMTYGMPPGLTATWGKIGSDSIVTIKGKPTTAGSYIYKIEPWAVNPPPCGKTLAFGLIVIKPINTIKLLTVGKDSQSVCQNTPIDTIRYATTGATGVNITGLTGDYKWDWTNDIITITGTPTTLGKLTYKIDLIGGCGVVDTTGTITVTGPNSLTLTSGNKDQTLCANDVPIADIKIATMGVAGASVKGLPAGVTGTWSANVFTITGKPTQSGTFPYTVSQTGGCPGNSILGVLTVLPTNTISLSSGSDKQSICKDSTIVSIIYATTGATGINNDGVDGGNGLPVGMNAKFSGNATSGTITISGKTSTVGTYNYTLTLTGGCGIIDTTGTITVDDSNWASPASSSPRLCINTILPTITHTTTGATGIAGDGADGANGLPKGVAAKWSANTITIDGKPTESGVFRYKIPLIGKCGNAFAQDTITVDPNNTSPSVAQQRLCMNTPLTTITHPTTGATGIASDGIDGANGLPPGVSATWKNDVVTITGKPTKNGEYKYFIPLTGGCGADSAKGTITVDTLNTVGPMIGLAKSCINVPLSPISHLTTGVTGIQNDGVPGANGLPAGVSGTWRNDSIIIGGMPITSGTFPYNIPVLGGCGGGVASGTIVIKPDNTITLFSNVGTDNQSPCINQPIIHIVYKTTGATGAIVNGLPIGVNGDWRVSGADSIVTISGSPSVTSITPFQYDIQLIGGCGNATAKGTIDVISSNVITLTSGSGSDQQQVCEGYAIAPITYTTKGATGATFSGLPTGVTGTWSNNQISISGAPSPSSAVPYTYTITITGGCGTVETTGTITVTPIPLPPSATASVNFCSSDYPTVKDLQMAANVVGQNIKWYGTPTGGTPIDTSLHLVLGKSTYYASQTINGCESVNRTQIDAMVYQDPKPTMLLGTSDIAYQELEYKQPAKEFTAYWPSSEQLTYQWYGTDKENDQVGNKIDGATASTYTPLTNKLGISYYFCVVTILPQGCKGTSPKAKVKVNSIPLFVTLDTIVHNPCPQDKVGKIIVKVDGGVPYTINRKPYSITWTGPDGYLVKKMAKQQRVKSNYFAAPSASYYLDSISGLAAGDYYITATDSLLISITGGPYTVKTPDEIRITATIKQINKKKQQYGQISVTATGGTPPYHFEWTSDHKTNLDSTATITDLAPGTYTVRVTDANGCEAHEARFKIDQTLDINTFTPNGDGTNDIFLENFYLQIFTRNGILVYEGENGWNGTFNDKPMENDTYFFVAKYKSDSEIEYKTGYVTLVR
jgi:gliding motility-associated-like protein